MLVNFGLCISYNWWTAAIAAS